MTDTKPTIMNLTSNDDVPLSDCVRRQAKQPSVCHLRIFEEAPWDTTVRYTIVQAREALYAIKAKVPNNDMRILSNNLDHRLLTLLHSVPRSSQIYPILLAMQVFGILVIRETELLCAVVETLIPRLIHSLESRLTCQTMPTQEYWCGLAWCLWIGTVSTVPHSENWEWFYQHLSQLIPRIGIVDCVQLKVAMQQFLWDDVRCETTLREYGSALVLQKGNEPTASESMDG